MGVMLRVLLLVHLCALVTVLIAEPHPDKLADAAIVFAAWLELPLMTVFLLLFLTLPWLQGLPRGLAIIAVLLLCAVIAVTWLYWLGAASPLQLARGAVWAAAVAGLVLMYFDWLARRHSPALVEAKLMALTARIRPHFLFNALNGVLGVMRSDPRRAERALEALADVFRAQMRENRELVPLSDELEVCERYLDLEQLRLGDRLKVEWSVDDAARNALVPPLVLQPLLENAVYHGVEPSYQPQPVNVSVSVSRTELRLSVANTLADRASHHTGNRMALDNIRERLLLFFDLEARLTVRSDDTVHRVDITMPLRLARAPTFLAAGGGS